MNNQPGNRTFKRAALAYSGGVDTTACITYLRESMGVSHVVAVTVNIGQPDDLTPVRDKAYKAGADEAVVIDARERFANEFARPALFANALYEGSYPLISALGRPLIAAVLVEEARRTQADAVAHGSTGKGNDQVRFELACAALAPDLAMLTPARIWNMDRAASIRYSEAHGIAPEVSVERPYAIDENILGRNVEAGPLEDEWREPEEEVFTWTKPKGTSLPPEYCEIAFEGGLPVRINNEPVSFLQAIARLNEIAGRHGVGRIDMIESRLTGTKSREIYEAPGWMSLLVAHSELEKLVLSSRLIAEKARLEPAFSQLVFEGNWFSDLRPAMVAFLEKSQERVTGTVRLLFDGPSVRAIGRKSPHTLYRHELATYGAGNEFPLESSEHFTRISTLHGRVWGLAGRRDGTR